MPDPDIDLAALAKPMSGKKNPAPTPTPAEPADTKEPEPMPTAAPPKSKSRKKTRETWAEANRPGNVYLPPALRKAATAHAETMGLSFSAYVRGLIETDLREIDG